MICGILLLASVVIAQENNFGNVRLFSHDMHATSSFESAVKECSLYCCEHLNCAGFFTSPDSDIPNRQNCYLEGADYRKYIKKYMPESVKHPRSKDGLQSGDGEAFVARNIRGPLVVDTNMVVNLEQHFVRGCSYTISMWVYLNEPAKIPDVEIPIFSTRDTSPIRTGLEAEETLQPSIVYNVGSGVDYQDRGAFFFSAFKDNDGLFHGFWAQGSQRKVRYNEWMHLVMVIFDDKLTGYVNGESIGSSPLMSSRQTKDHGSNVGGVMMCPYTFPTEGNHQKPYHPKEALNNTVLQVLGVNGGRREATPGMIQDLIVIRSKALKPFDELSDSITGLMNLRPPVELPTLKKLARIYGKSASFKESLQSDGPLGGIWEIFEGKALGLCATAVCGRVCLDPNWLHQDYSGAKRKWQLQHANEGRSYRAGGLRRTGMVDDGVVDIKPSELDEIFDFYGDGGNEETIDSGGNSKREMWAENTEKAVIELYDGAMQWLSGNAHNNRTHALALNAIHENSQDAFDRIHSRLGAKDAAVLWKKEAHEQSFSALVMALWLAADLDIAYPDKNQPWWNYRYANMIQQPIQLALAYRQGIDKESKVVLPHDLGKYLTISLGGENLADHIRKAYAHGIEENSIADNADNNHDTYPSFAEFSEERSQMRNIQGEVLLSAAEYTTSQIHWLHALASIDSHGYFMPKDNGTHIISELHELLRPLVKTGLVTEALLKKADPLRVKPKIVDHLRQASDNDGFDLSIKYDSDSECLTALAHLFTVSQSVTANYGIVDNGITAMEDVRIMTADLKQHAGIDNDDHQFNELEANQGNPDAQLYLARRFFWGQGGVRPDPDLARHWFEAAAEQLHPEALYNLGVLYNTGQLGYSVNNTKAVELFKQAANPLDGSPPFAMALYAVGTYYQNDPENKDINKAIDYYVRACATGSVDAHFSLFFIFQTGEGLDNTPNIPLAMHHLVESVNSGHVRAMNFLAHGLYDPESWLSGYGRESAYASRYGLENLAQGVKKEFDHTILRSGPVSSWVYNSSEPFQVRLPVGVVNLPVPLGSGDGCPAALHLMKHLSFMSYRANDLVNSALEEYSEHFDPRNSEALGLYDEGAELGIPQAQANSKYLYQLLQETECVPELGGAEVNQKQCMKYYKMMRERRLVQLGNSGDIAAKREIAFLLLEETKMERSDLSCTKAEEKSKIQEAAELLILASEQGDIESLFSLGWMFARNDAPFKNKSMSRLLFNTAESWEQQLQGQGLTVFEQGYTAYSTFGLASILAKFYLRVDDFLEDLGFRSIESVISAWKSFLHSIYGVLYLHKPQTIVNPFSLSYVYEKLGNDNQILSLMIGLNLIAILFVFGFFVAIRYRKRR